MSSKAKSSDETGGGAALLPKLRFPEFHDEGGWESRKVDDLVDTVAPLKKLQTSDYKTEGKFPIIDQSPVPICGWTDDGEAVIKNGLPLIVFGDHTCTLKFVDHPFVQGADGIKIIRPKRAVDTRFVFCALNADPVKQDGYKRHFSILKEKRLSFPNFDTGEQQKIALCLVSADMLIAAQGRKVEALRAHKKGLMQRLFPQEGETQPRLRFPEFEGKGEWSQTELGRLIEIKGRIGYRGYTVADIVGPREGAIALSPSNISDDGSLVFQKTTFISWMKYNESPEIMVEKGQTLLVKTGSTYGKSAFVRELPQECTVNPQIVVLKPISVDPFFLSLLIANDVVQNKIEENVVGGAIPTLSQDSISKFKVHVPKDSEQQRIANCLSTLDDLIDAETQKLDTLKTHKKGLMQQLFPQVGEDEA